MTCSHFGSSGSSRVPEHSMHQQRSDGVKATPCISQRSSVVILSFLVSLIHGYIITLGIHNYALQ